MSFDDTGCTVKTKVGQSFARVPMIGNIYPVQLRIHHATQSNMAYVTKTIIDKFVEYTPDEIEKHVNSFDVAMSATVTDDIQLWHRKLGHLNMQAVQELANGKVTGINIP